MIALNELQLVHLVYSWSNNCYLEFQSAVLVAIRAAQFQVVTLGFWTVTAEVASSSLVVPAIHSKQLGVIGSQNSNPQLLYCPRHPYRAQKFALRGARLIAVFLCVQIERRLNL